MTWCDGDDGTNTKKWLYGLSGSNDDRSVPEHSKKYHFTALFCLLTKIYSTRFVFNNLLNACRRFIHSVVCEVLKPHTVSHLN